MSAPEPERRSRFRLVWKWIAGIATALVAIAGFASPEFRSAVCLDLPSQGDLRYPAESGGNISFKRISTQSQQPSLGGERLAFRARYYGETMMSVFVPMLGPEKHSGYAYLNLRPLEFVDEETPLGPTSSQLPDVVVLVPADEAGSLVALEQGAVVEVRGEGRWLDVAEEGSQWRAIPQTHGKLTDAWDFYVLAEEIEVLKPLNAPEDRFLCSVFHDLER